MEVAISLQQSRQIHCYCGSLARLDQLHQSIGDLRLVDELILAGEIGGELKNLSLAE